MTAGALSRVVTAPPIAALEVKAVAATTTAAIARARPFVNGNLRAGVISPPV
jgi:hypothetical protein